MNNNKAILHHILLQSRRSNIIRIASIHKAAISSATPVNWMAYNHPTSACSLPTHGVPINYPIEINIHATAPLIYKYCIPAVLASTDGVSPKYVPDISPRAAQNRPYTGKV